jgi:hypothetical protein
MKALTSKGFRPHKMPTWIHNSKVASKVCFSIYKFATRNASKKTSDIDKIFIYNRHFMAIANDGNSAISIESTDWTRDIPYTRKTKMGVYNMLKDRKEKLGGIAVDIKDIVKIYHIANKIKDLKFIWDEIKGDKEVFRFVLISDDERVSETTTYKCGYEPVKSMLISDLIRDAETLAIDDVQLETIKEKLLSTEGNTFRASELNITSERNRELIETNPKLVFDKNKLLKTIYCLPKKDKATISIRACKDNNRYFVDVFTSHEARGTLQSIIFNKQ